MLVEISDPYLRCSAALGVPAINHSINSGSCPLSARDDRLCRTKAAQSMRNQLAPRARKQWPAKSYTLCRPPTIALRYATPYSYRYCTYLWCNLAGSAEPDVLRGAWISVATPR